MAWIAQDVLKIIGEAAPNDCITEAALEVLAGLRTRQVELACYKLRRHGLIEKIEPGCYKLTAAGRAALASGASLRSGPKGPHTGKRIVKDSLRIRVWRAIRIRRKFSLPELISLVAQGGEKDIESNIRKYINALTRAGILTELPRREAGMAAQSNGYKRWWLTDEKDTGPEAPVWMQARAVVYDPNTEQEHAA